MPKPIVYAVYRGDKFIDLGTKYQLAKKLNVSPETIDYYSTPVHKNRIKNYEKGLLAIKIKE